MKKLQKIKSAKQTISKFSRIQMLINPFISRICYIIKALIEILHIRDLNNSWVHVS